MYLRIPAAAGRDGLRLPKEDLLPLKKALWTQAHYPDLDAASAPSGSSRMPKPTRIRFFHAVQRLMTGGPIAIADRQPPCLHAIAPPAHEEGMT